jgi:hypothetical protein
MLTRDEIEQLAQLYAEQLGVDPAQFINQLKSRYGQNYEQLASMSANDVVEALGAIGAAPSPTPAATASSPSGDLGKSLGINPNTVIQPSEKQPPVTTPNYQAPQAPSGQKFSQYDDVFKKYAGSLANDSDFLRIVNATVKAESGHNPNAVGDGGKSIGLFQMHEQGAGAGMSAADRSDPDKASSVMIPRFVAMYQQGKQQGLSGTDLASFVARNVERPLGYDDPNGAAARKYISAYQEFGGQLGSAYAGAENDTGNPNQYQWKSLGQNINGGNVSVRPFGTVGISGMTEDELRKFYPFMDSEGDTKQAAYNLVTSRGIDPFSNPYQRMYLDTAEDLGKQAYIQNLLDTGKSGDYANVANLANSALGAGRVSLFGSDPREAINRIKNIGATNGIGLEGDMGSFYSQNLETPESAARLLAAIVGPGMSRGLQRHLPETLNRNLLRVRQELPGQNVNPFVALARSMGY